MKESGKPRNGENPKCIEKGKFRMQSFAVVFNKLPASGWYPISNDALHRAPPPFAPQFLPQIPTPTL